MRYGMLAAAVCLAATLCSCRQDVPDGSAVPAPSQPDFSQGMPIADPPADKSQPEIPWTLDRADEAAQRVYIATQNGGCSYPIFSSIREDESSITITVYGTKASEPCTQELVTVQTYIQMPSPINGREIRGSSRLAS
jgi:hypothetical protein